MTPFIDRAMLGYGVWSSHHDTQHPKRTLRWQNMTHNCTKKLPQSWDNSMCILPWQQWFSNQRPLLLHLLVFPAPSCNNCPTKMTETKGFDAWTCIGIKCSNDFERFWVLPIVPSKLNAQQTLVIPYKDRMVLFRMWYGGCLKSITPPCFSMLFLWKTSHFWTMLGPSMGRHFSLALSLEKPWINPRHKNGDAATRLP